MSTAMPAESECWLLSAEGAILAQCLPGRTVADAIPFAKHPGDASPPEFPASVVVDRLGDLWFATLTAPGAEVASLNGERVEPGGTRLLETGDNTLELGGSRFLLRVRRDADVPTAGPEAELDPGSLPETRHRQLLALITDPVFHSGLPSDGMAKITYRAVEVLGADRASLWLYNRPRDQGGELELRSRFVEGSTMPVPIEDRPPVVPSAVEFLGGVVASFLGIEILADGEACHAALRQAGMVEGATRRALVAAVGGGREECLGFLVVESAFDGGGRDWVAEDLLAARGLAGLALRALDAREKKDAIARLAEAETRLASELKAAGNYVRQILPPPVPAGAVRVDWCFLPSAQLGGDSFGYHWVGERFFVSYILDVVGHGSGAALLAISVSNAIRSLLLRDAHRAPDPAAVLAHLNASFPMEEQSDLTFSMWFGVFDAQSRELCFSSGGHPPALLIHPDAGERCGARATELGTEGVAIGSWADYPYANGRTTVPRGAKLFLYSDGAYEIPLEGGGPWSFAEFVNLVRNTAHMADGEIEYLRKRIRSLLGAPAFPDDFSILRLSFDAAPV